MKKFAVILNGCGHLDGSEVHESVMTLLAIDRSGNSYTVFAPNADQYHVMNHQTRQPMEGQRNMLVEAARISRGNVHDLNTYQPENYDALVLPGGFGVAKNLFTYAIDGIHAQVIDSVRIAVEKTHNLHKPIGALCIAPMLLSKILGNITVTLGTDPQSIRDAQTFGATHQKAHIPEVVYDANNLIFTTPCYMLDTSISGIADSANNLIQQILVYLNNNHRS